MPDDVIDALVRGDYPDPDGGPNLDVHVRSVAIRDTLDGLEADLLRELDLGDVFAVVFDDSTYQVLGRRVEAALGASFSVTGVSLGDRPEPDEAAVARLVDGLPAGTDALVAVGTGSVNDVCKAAASRLERPYVVFPTAPSVNGYASISASITTAAGFKQSLRADPPVGVFVDLGVLAGAPVRLIRGGLGESLNRCTAQADWLLAHLLLGQPYRSAPFELLRTQEDELFAHSDALVAGDRECLARLARSLVLAGMGMTICGGSVSSSQGEHLISHYIDMMRGPDDPHFYHGEQIGVTTVVMAGLQQRLLAMDAPPVLAPTAATRDDLIAHFGSDSGERAWAELDAKRLTAERADELNAALAEHWDEWRARIRAIGRPADELRAVLERAGSPARPADLGWSDDRMREACLRARQLRKRFTFLDVAADAGIDPLG